MPIPWLGRGTLHHVSGGPAERGIGATWFMPQSGSEPLLIDIPGASLDFAVVTCESRNRLDDLWNAPAHTS